MATTTPDNLWSPNASDPYNLTVDLATMQSTVQSALNNKSTKPISAASVGALPPGEYPGQFAWVSSPAPGFVVHWNGSSWTRDSPEDTGWVYCTTRSGFSGQGGNPMRVRRIGNYVHAVWGWSNAGMSASTAHTVGDVPVGFRPSSGISYFVGVSSSGNIGSRFSVGSDGAVVISTANPLGAYYLAPAGAGWFTD